MSKYNGGPAFPFGQTDELSGQLVNGWGSEGMTLRDYFAAKAMQSLIARYGHQSGGLGEMSANAYEIADAMIAERAK